jgi:hypothetical protein
MEQIRFPKSDGATDPYNSTAGWRGRSEEVSEAGADVARHGSPTSAPGKLEPLVPRLAPVGQDNRAHRAQIGNCRHGVRQGSATERLILAGAVVGAVLSTFSEAYW